MPLIEDVVWQLVECYSKGTFVAFTLWTDEDVRGRAEELGVRELTQEECEEVLRRADEGHDASVGINWNVLGTHILDIVK